MPQSSSPIIALITVGVAVTISVLVRQGRRQSRSTTLAPRERIRPLMITLLDPVISVMIIGPFIWHFVAHSHQHVVAAMVGAILGIAIGYAPARVMFVRAIKETKSVVLRRSGAEYGLVLVLVVLRTAQGSVEHSSSSLAQSLVTGLAGLALVEAISRSAFIVRSYHHRADTTSTLALDADRTE